MSGASYVHQPVLTAAYIPAYHQQAFNLRHLCQQLSNLIRVAPVWIAPLHVLAAPVKDDAYRRQVTQLQERAFDSMRRFNFQEADERWSDIIRLDDSNAAAYSNRGNTRTSSGRCNDAIQDFDRAIDLAPSEADPFLGRGVAHECLRQFDAALQDYAQANEKNRAMTGRDDPVTYNNRANAEAGLGRYREALQDYQRASALQRQYIFPKASAALMQYQLGQEVEAVKQLRLLQVAYPSFTDVNAALTAIYWKQKEPGKAETLWVQVLNEDPRYRNIEWVRDIRRWPPRMVDLLDDFQNLRIQH